MPEEQNYLYKAYAYDKQLPINAHKISTQTTNKAACNSGL